MSNKNGLAGGIIAVVIVGIILIAISTAAEGALTGIGRALSAIPEWLRIVLFVGAILVVVRLSNKSN